MLSQAPAERNYNMARRRLILVHSVIAVLVLGSGFDIVTGREHWPFSPYPMFAGVRSRQFSRWVIFGVIGKEGSKEISIQELPYRDHPIDVSRLQLFLVRVRNKRDGRQLMEDAMTDYLVRYEKRRKAGEHPGPPLHGMRLYRLDWRLDAWARNRDTPERKMLVFEIRRQDRDESLDQ
jgi:hypothetical protein